MKSGRGRWLFLIVLLWGLGGFGAFWYATSAGTDEIQPDFGGTYIEGMAGTPNRVNPLFADQNDADATLVSLVYAGLTRLDERGQPFPDLAETWTVSPDGVTYTFTLRRGLLWQDETPLTADDVRFTYELLQAPSLRLSQPVAKKLSAATFRNLDARTFIIELAAPMAGLPAFLTLGILPAHLLAAVSPADLATHPFNQGPVGAGPYELVELTPAGAVLRSNPAYHFGQPFIQHLELRFYRDDGLVRSALDGGEIDGALLRGLSSRERVDIESSKGLALYPLATPEMTCVFFNLDAPLFQDRRLRQALLQGVDRQALVAGQLEGRARELKSLLPGGAWASRDAFERYGYDSRTAALLLDEAGWRADESGARHRGNERLSLTLVTNSDPLHAAVAGAIVTRWQALGVDATLDVVGATTLVRERLETRRFEAVLLSVQAPADLDAHELWHGSAGSGNVSGLSSERVDAIIDEGRKTPSAPQRRQIMERLQGALAEEVPAMPLYQSELAYVLPESMRGVKAGYVTSPGDRFWQVQEWHLRTR